MFAETTNVFPGCFRRSARRVDMLREFHLALAGRGEVNGSNAPRDGNTHREVQMCRVNVDGFSQICTAISVPWRIPVSGGVHLTSRSSPRASLARTRRRPARPTSVCVLMKTPIERERARAPSRRLRTDDRRAR